MGRPARESCILCLTSMTKENPGTYFRRIGIILVSDVDAFDLDLQVIYDLLHHRADVRLLFCGHQHCGSDGGAV